MALHGACFQTYNNELLKSIEDLSDKREELSMQIQKEEDDKDKLLKEFSERLLNVNESLARKKQAREEYDKSINDTEVVIYGGILRRMFPRIQE